MIWGTDVRGHNSCVARSLSGLIHTDLGTKAEDLNILIQILRFKMTQNSYC